VKALPHTFDPGATPASLRRYERDPDWRLPALVTRYPRLSTDRETAEAQHLEWVTPGHPLFEALRRHTLDRARRHFAEGACFYELGAAEPSRFDVYRARIVDGLGRVIHERLFAVRLSQSREPALLEVGALGNLQPAPAPASLPPVALESEPLVWLHQEALQPFLEEVRKERVAELDRIAAHVELSLTELIDREDRLIGRLLEDRDRGVEGAAGNLAQAEERQSALLQRRERRREELERQRALSLQAVERLTTAVVLPHPEAAKPEIQRLRPDPETEATAMRVAMHYERAQGRAVADVHEQNLGYDLTSLDTQSGELRLIEVKGIGDATGAVLLTPNERRVAEDRRDCYWLYVVTHCRTTPRLQEPIKDPARLPRHEVKKVDHYWLAVDALTQPMLVHEEPRPYEGTSP
jgi:Protein NO VEIN, C-terminal